jgi:hypothetical protein
MKKTRKKKTERWYTAFMDGGPLDGLSVLTSGQPLLMVEDIIEKEKTVLYVKHAYQMNLKSKHDENKEEELLYEYVGWLNTDEQDIRSLNPELN